MSLQDQSHAPPPEMPRFGFGRNWQRFRAQLTERRLERAIESLQPAWPQNSDTVSFLDAGCGSGIFSLAARKRGARVHSFDYDPDSVACTLALKQQEFPDDPHWIVESGSVLDAEYLRSLEPCDLVYSWGVLHHTGDLWDALEKILIPLKPGGKLIIAIYNDQGWKSRLWTLEKRIYCSSWLGRWLMTAFFVPAFLSGFFLSDLLKGRSPLARYRDSHDPRGMSVLIDIIDWIGGYPFEVASPQELIDFYQSRGLKVIQQKRTNSLGCNEFIFQKSPTSTP